MKTILMFLIFLALYPLVGNGWEQLMIDLHVYDTINTLKEN